ncbi:MAG: amidohydrolase, partial [Nitrososphaerota archaeon]|nr:amidohydrolase [Nitrososphaerota archaeon]
MGFHGGASSLLNHGCAAIIFYVETQMQAVGRKVFYGRVFSRIGVGFLLATLALLNAHIKTMDPKQPTANAVAVFKNKILKVGTNQQIQAYIGSGTLVLDLKNKTVVPGLIDTHIHVTDYGRCLMWLDLSSVRTLDELKGQIQKKAQITKPGRWIVGQGWNETRFREQRMPNIAELDAAAPNHPVILYREAAMICAVNSLALKIAGVTPQMSAPMGGNIDRDPKTGELRGIFRDTATTLIWQAVPEPEETELLEATAYAAQKVTDAGITSVAWLVNSAAELAIIKTLYLQGRLPFRVNVVVSEALLKNVGAFPSDDFLRVGGVFIVVDGYLDSKEAALSKPYNDEPKNLGKLFLTPTQLNGAIAHAGALGIQPVIHAMGDRALEATLTAIEQAPKQIRFRIEQAAVLDKPLIARLKKQNVIISIQPRVIATEFEVWSAKQRLGNRAQLLHPLKTLVDLGVVVTAGSDCPMEPLSVLLGIQELVLRRNYPKQRLGVNEALQLYTLNAAYCLGEETKKGSIEEGKLADFTILSKDLEAVEPASIKDVAVEGIVVDGKVLTDIRQFKTRPTQNTPTNQKNTKNKPQKQNKPNPNNTNQT